jgi:phage-related minor tail protein
MARNETKIEITAEDKTAPAFSSLNSRLLGIEQSYGKISGMIGALSAAAAVGFIATSVKQAADFADEMGKAAQKVGTTTEALSGLKYAADLSGVSFEQLQTGLSKLAKTTEDFRDGSKSAVDAFAKINLDPTKFKDTSELFGAVADKLSKMEDGARKTAIAQELLGKSGKELIPLLNSGADGLKDMADEAQRFGLIVDEKTSKAAENFKDNITRISSAAEGFKIAIGNTMLPAIVDLTQGFLDLIQASDGFYAGFLAAFENKSGAEGMADAEQRLAKLTKTRDAFNNAGAISRFYNADDIAILNTQIDLAQKEFNTYSKLADIERNRAENDTKRRNKPSSVGTEAPAVSGVTKSKSTGKSDAEKYAEDMAKLIRVFDDAAQPAQTVSEKLQSQLDAYTTLDPSVRAYAQSLIAQKKAQEDAIASADALNESLERNNEMMAALQAYDDADQSIYNANSETYNAILRETQDINAALIENDVERARRQIEIEHERRLARIDLLEGEADQVEAIREAEIERYEAQLKTINAKTKVNSNLGKDLGLTFKSAFEDAIVEGKKFGDVLKSLEQDIIRILTRRIVTDPLTKGIDGILDSFEFNADGGVYNSPSLSNYSGQVVSKPTMFAFASGAGIMGEAGAEGIFPLKRGKDGKLGVSAEGAMGGGTNVVVNLIESPGNGGQVNQQQNGNNLTIDVMVEKIESMMGRNISQGRGIAPAMERQYGLNRAAGAY